MKNKKAVLVLIAVILIAAGASLLAQNYSSSQKGFEAAFQTDTGEVDVVLEIANTSSERKKGLMYRKSMAENHGMIFVFPEEDDRSFWMKNTHIPLDIIFIDANQTVINIEKAYPESDTREENLRRYESDRPAKYVVELNQNFTDRNGIETGDKIMFENFDRIQINTVNSPNR